MGARKFEVSDVDAHKLHELSTRLISGKIGHLEFLETLKSFGEIFLNTKSRIPLHKENILAELEQIIADHKLRDRLERDRLAREAEDWLMDPAALFRDHGPQPD